ncbi:MAG TPA: sugar ABC transporter permease [Phototrophicaceae bacterium]|nr:sugar ABC transporter permease [Phototrophicaceae bacterium]
MNRDRLTAILMLSPSVILIAIFVYGFIAWTGYTSLTNSTQKQRLAGETAEYVGLKNYDDLFTGLLNERFRIDMVNTVFFTLMFIVACLLVGILLAILLDQQILGEGIFRTIFLFPMALSFVVTGVAWKWLFNPGSGLNVLPTIVGLPAGEFYWFISQDQWLTFNWQNVLSFIVMLGMGFGIFFSLRRRSQISAIIAAAAFLLLALTTFDVPRSSLHLPDEMHGFNVALVALTVAAGWQMSGYTMAMYLAGLRGVSDDLREAARVDGCNEWQMYRHIIFPLLQPITLSAMIILGHISLKIFDLVYTMGGGNNLFIDMPGMNMYQTTFRASKYGVGAAIAVIMLVMVALVIVPYLYTQLRSETQL